MKLGANSADACHATKCCSSIISDDASIECNYNKKQDCLSRVVMVTDEKPQILNCNIQFYFK